MKQITISCVTVGEPQTLECLDRLNKLTPYSFDLTVWYDTCGKGLDVNFLNALHDRTDDIIISSKNRGPISENAFSVLYSDTPYVLIISPDVMVTEKYYEKLMIPFNHNPKIGMVGEPAYDIYGLEAHKLNYLIGTVVEKRTGSVAVPDMAVMLKREAINDCGGISPSLKFYGYDYIELSGRMEAKGWSSALVLGIIDRTKLSNSSIGSNTQLSELSYRNELVMRQLKYKNFSGYDWWRNDLMKNEEIYWECLNVEKELEELHVDS